VLFRGGSEQTIRKGLVDNGNDLIEAVIGLPTNLFYGAGIPAAIIVLNKNKAKDRKNKIIFINAELEFEEGKNQNKLRQTDILKIVSTFDNFHEIKRYSKIVSIEEIRENDFNLNIRRYADTSPPQETFDVKAILNGGVPKREVEEEYIQEMIQGIDLQKIFELKDKDYFVFRSTIASKEHIRMSLKGASDRAVTQVEKWWDKYSTPLRLIEKECVRAENEMNKFLSELGYE
ncbi:MAG: N-6 DNA methylase, partial [Pseudobdellovibrio sp.]